MDYKVEYKVITPEDAEALLAKNYKKNRKIKNTAVSRYAQDMLSGNWDPKACGPIIVSESGELLDGQHRLKAVVQSGCAIEMEIRSGVPDGSYEKVDQGVKRSAADILHMPYASYISALCSNCIVLGRRRGAEVNSFDCGSTNGRYVSTTNIVKFYRIFNEQYPEAIEDAIRFSKTEAAGYTGWRSTSLAIPALALRITDEDLYERFKNVVLEDDDVSKSGIALRLWRVRAGNDQKLTQSEERYIVWHMSARVATHLISGKDQGFRYKKGAALTSKMPNFNFKLFDVLGFGEDEEV